MDMALITYIHTGVTIHITLQVICWVIKLCCTKISITMICNNTMFWLYHYLYVRMDYLSVHLYSKLKRKNNLVCLCNPYCSKNIYSCMYRQLKLFLQFAQHKFHLLTSIVQFLGVVNSSEKMVWKV